MKRSGRPKLLNRGAGLIRKHASLMRPARPTVSMRSKEDAPDYRYFPDPDLLNVELDDAFIRKAQEKIPELPDQKLNSIIEQFGIPKNDAIILTKDKAVSDFFGGLCTHLSGYKKDEPLDYQGIVQAAE